MPGNLFTNYFLTEGIKATAEWRASISDSTAFAAFRDGIRQRYDALSGSEGPNEAVTEQELIRPVLELLGWADYLPQQGTTRNEDIPDYLLFTDAASKERAAGRTIPEERFRDAIVVEESKRFGLSLDARDRDAGRQSKTPHGQILRYLSTADIESESRIRWGFLTNGGLWRLYDYRARPRATGYFEADLGEMLGSGGEDVLRLFYLLFRRDSFTPQEGATTSFLEAALAQGRRYEEKVAQDLSSVVFERVFPKLVQALADATAEDLSRVRHAALILLYRLLFVLYAEDRGLLPVNDSRYEDYGLRKPVRDHVAHRMQGGGVFSASASSYYDHLLTLFRQIDEGDESIGLPPYNGGLFASEAAPLLKTARLTDKIVGDVIYDLSHTETEGTRHFVNYQDMSVQQLGSIYERLLEREPVRDDNGGIVVRPNSYARKDSGSFFTPQELVDLIVDRTLKPLAEERLKAFEDKSKELRSDHRPIAERHAELLALDPAEAVLDLKVLDPAMGSGHFLVTACLAANLNAICVDFVARQKAQGTHLNWYILEQLPVIAPEGYDQRFGDQDARDLVRDHVLRLTYTANDMAPFARDLGYDGPPFIWDEEERRHLRARLDALYFHLYGLSREDAGYVLETFPIVRRQDEAAFGSYRTRDLILAYMNALAAGDTDTVVSV